jgi:hypothetical protein
MLFWAVRGDDERQGLGIKNEELRIGNVRIIWRRSERNISIW